MKLTDSQKLEYLISALGDGDEEKYEAWILWCEKTEPEKIPGYFGFNETFSRLDTQYIREWEDGVDFKTWFKSQPKETQ